MDEVSDKRTKGKWWSCDIDFTEEEIFLSFLYEKKRIREEKYLNLYVHKHEKGSEHGWCMF